MSEKEDDVDSVGEVGADETTVDQEPTSGAEDEFHPFAEMSEEYKPSAIPKVTAADGMPTQAYSTQSDIPVLSTETLVCMEDRSEFVVRGTYGEITARFKPADVDRQPDGTYTVSEADKSQRTEVEPIRPRCRHYVRQVAMFEHNSEAKVHLRLCAARRTTEGTFMTLRDSAMWACSMREPRDLSTEIDLLEKFDADKIEQGANREHFSIFSDPQSVK